MSVSTAVSRMAELQALISPLPAPAPAPPTAPATGTQGTFAAQLAGAQSAAAPAAPRGAAGGESQYDGLIQQAAQRNGVDPALLKGLIRQESNFDPDAGSPAGAQGLCQLMPGTAAGLGVSDLRDPAQSIEGGAKYLRQQLDAFGGDVTKALAAYNAGPGAVQRYGGVPPYAETQNYVRQVQAYAAQYRTAAPAAPTPTPATGLAYSTT
ncbi:MAG TPA: lytic transglycosylase domain-containing protein [Solirubrobacteraceae bacterium]